MQSGGRALTRRWPNDSAHATTVIAPRDDVVLESSDPETQTLQPTDDNDDGAALAPSTDLEYSQSHGPFTAYRRRVTVEEDRIVERTAFRLCIPWFGWLFRPPVKAVLARKISHRGWWAPPDRLDATQALVLGLLAAASMSAAFVNTLFTQTVNFAADDFGISDTGIGIAGAVVRGGILIALPAAIIADRVGRRRVIVVVAWLGPLLSILGAFSPTFGFLVVIASNTVRAASKFPVHPQSTPALGHPRSGRSYRFGAS